MQGGLMPLVNIQHVQSQLNQHSSIQLRAARPTRVKQAGHGQEDLHALANHQLNLALLPAQRRALSLAHKGDLRRARESVKRQDC